MSKKLTIEFVRNEFAKEGYTLLSKEYKNNRQKLGYVCPKGHRHSMTWTHWRRGITCPYCSKKAKPTIELIKESFELEGYTLLSKKYSNAKQKIEYICHKGHKNSMTWSNWQQGKRCPICANIRSSLNQMGSNNHAWRGGKSFEPYCEVWKDKKYKADIRNRDGNKCLNPYCDSKDPNDLTIHHIDYNKKNCHPSNLITVCRSCNTKANKDREWHRSWYQAIIKNKYGGKFYANIN